MTQMRISGNTAARPRCILRLNRDIGKMLKFSSNMAQLLLSIDVRNNEGPHLTRGSVGEGHMHDVVQFRVTEQGKMCIMLIFTGLQ